MRHGELKKLQELVEPDSSYIQVVQYHRVRWLSLADCVGRVVHLLPVLVRYFILDRSNRPAITNKYRNLHSRLSKPRFQLYLYFLKLQLELLANINKWLQRPSLSIHVYSKSKALLSAFIEPVALDSRKSVSDPTNSHSVDEAIALFPGAEFQEQYLHCKEHSLLSNKELNSASKDMYQYVVVVGKAIDKNFQSLTFMVSKYIISRAKRLPSTIS